jgi:hypothetical protein
MVVLALVFSALNVARAESFVFETSMARLVIQSNGAASSLIEKQNGKEQLHPAGLPIAVLSKFGHQFPATTIERSGALYHVTFGNSGVTANYRITAAPNYIVFELAAVQGDGIEKIAMVQLSTSLTNSGASYLSVRWDADFSVSLMGLSEEVDTEVAGPMISASVYPAFSMQGQRVAIIAAPTQQFLKAVQEMEHDFQLFSPAPTIGGTWAKLSIDARTSYLFTDLTEANADDTIRYAQMGGFKYILIYSNTWSASLGSYPINTVSFPHGETGLKSVIDKCHAAGLKVGMHMLTSFVGKSDPLVTPTPDPGLLKTGTTALATGVSAQATSVTLTSQPGGNTVSADSNDVVIGDEIIECGQINGVNFLRCARGFAGTRAMPHEAGAKAQILAQSYGSYLADLRSPLASTISDRISGVINRVGFDMIYFDGGEVNAADGPSWYWVGVQQSQIMQRTKRDLLVEGSGITNWTWHVLTRYGCDDFAAVAVKQYLDLYKLVYPYSWHQNSFLPSELGWVGFLQDAPDHPATSPDELELHAVRMLALGLPIGLETHHSVLQANGRTEEMLKMLGTYEQLRLSGAVPAAVRSQLAKGEWHMTAPGVFQPVHYDVQRMAIPGESTFLLLAHAQPLKFRLQVAPNLAMIGDQANIPLLQAQTPVEVQPPGTHDLMPGVLAKRISFSNVLDLTTHRALAVQLTVEGPVQASGKSPVLNLQLEAGGNTYRDYYVDLDFQGSKTVILPEPSTRRTLAEFWPASSNYSFKSAMQTYNYENVDALNLRWMRYVSGSGIRCHVKLVEALQERPGTLTNIEISAGSAKIAIPGAMQTGDYAEYWGEGPIRIFDKNGFLLRTAPAYQTPTLTSGANNLVIKASGSGTVKMTAITLGN